MVDVHEDVFPSSPPPLSDSYDNLPSSPPATKPKKKPPVTPRSFKRFFTPRSSLNASRSRSRFVRHALQDITSPALNRLGPAFPKVPDDVGSSSSKPSLDLFKTPTKKRKLSFCSSSSPLQSSPLRRVRIAPPVFHDVEPDFEPEAPVAVVEAASNEPVCHDENAPVPPPLRRSKAFQASPQFFMRNTSRPRSSRTVLRASNGMGLIFYPMDVVLQHQHLANTK